MDKELKARISTCEQEIALMKRNIDDTTNLLNHSIELLGKDREVVIKNVRENFRLVWEKLGKNLKIKEYDIPTEAEASISININSFTVPSFSNFQNIAPLINDGIFMAHKAIQAYGTLKGKIIPSPNNDSGIWWLNLITHVANFISEKARQREEEETAVTEYEKNVHIAIEKSKIYLDTINGLISRVYELRSNLRKLWIRFDQINADISEILPKFDTANNDHIGMYDKIQNVFMTILEYSKIEILDKNQRISEFDSNLIIRSKKLLA